MKRIIRGIFILATYMSMIGCIGFIIGIPKESEKRIGHDEARLSVLSEIPDSAIAAAKSNLHIAYGHTSHGSQIITGMTGLAGWSNAPGGASRYTWSTTATSGALHLFEGSGYDSGYLELHVTGTDTAWADEVREFLNASGNSEYNVIIYSWCGGVSDCTEEGMIDYYLTPMTALEADYPNVTFVYMTGHLAGMGETGNLNLRNEQIREYCEANDKWLYDFADIESYDPDDNYYLDRLADDGCYYDSDGDGSTEQTGDDANWATDWQNSHTEGIDWFDCSAAHTQPLNANMKAYAAWYLFARIAGWDGN